MDASEDCKQQSSLMESMDGSNSSQGAKFDQLQMLDGRENLVKNEAQVMVVTTSTNSSFDIPFSHLRTMDGQSIDIGQLSMINSQPIQLSSVMSGSGLGEITLMGTLMAPQAGGDNQLNLVQSVALDPSEQEADEDQVMNAGQNYTFTPIQNVFNVIGIPQGADQSEIYATGINCGQSLSNESSPEMTLNDEVKVKKMEPQVVNRNVVQNVQLSWPETTSMRSSNIQLVIPEEIAALNAESAGNTPHAKFVSGLSHHSLVRDRIPNPKYVSLLSSKSAEKMKTGKSQNVDVLSGNTRPGAETFRRTEADQSTTHHVDIDKKNKNEIYSMVLDQLLNQHSALVEMVTICQTVNTSESVQFEKAVRIFTEKLSGLLEFLGVVKNVIDSCLGRDLKVDQSTQTEEGGASPSGDASNSVYSSVSGRKIRQTERFQGFLELENSTTVSPKNEFKPHSRKRRRNIKSGSIDTNQLYEPPLQEASSSLEGNSIVAEGQILSESSLSVDSDSLGGIITNGTDHLNLEAVVEEKEKSIYLRNCIDGSKLDVPTNWVKHTTNLDVETLKPEVRRKKTIKSKKQYEAEAQFKFFCQNCSFKSKRESHFRRHMELHERFTELYTCKLCNFKTIRQSTLRKHEINHSSSKIRCKECPYVTDSDILLKRHVNVKHGSRKRRHRKEKSLTYVYKCSHCSLTVPNLAKYKLHLKTHNVDADMMEDLTYQCDQCNYKTKRKEHMKRHKTNHSGDRPHLCDTCGMTFKRSDTLSQHKQVHLEKVQRKLKFACQVCDKAFRSKCHLAEHMAMHSNNRQFLCDVCGASFKTKSCQLKHVRNIHQNPRSFPCNVCEKRFNTNYALKRHERTHENDLKMMPASANVLVPQNFLADVSAQAELVQATDIIIAPPMDESFEQGSDVKLQQVLSENNSAIMFLSSSLPTSWN